MVPDSYVRFDQKPKHKPSTGPEEVNVHNYLQLKHKALFIESISYLYCKL